MKNPSDEMITDSLKFEVKEIGTNNTIMYADSVLGLSITPGEILDI